MKFNSQEEEILATTMFQTLDTLQSPNVVCNQQGLVLFSSEVYKRLIDGESDNKFFWDVFPATHKIPGYFEKAVKQRVETRSEIRVKNSSFIVRVIPINNILKAESIYLVYFEDISAQINLSEQLKVDKRLLQKSFLDTILALSNFVESRDSYTSGHQKRVALLSLNIASKALITDPKCLSTIYYGALMHDIGKVAIPIEYLVTPRRLTNHEYEIIKTHATIGNKIIQHVDFPWDIKSVVYQHHERINGSGYPNGLKGHEMTIPAKIVAIADVYEAMSTNRPYRTFLPQETILKYLKENKGILFDEHYVDCLFQCLSDLKDIYEIHPDFRPFDIFDI